MITIAQIVNYGLPIVTFPLLVRTFDINEYGHWIEANTLGQFLLVFCVHGFGNALGALVVSKTDELSATSSNTLYLFLFLCTLISMLMLVAAPILNEWILRSEDGATLLRIVSFTIPIGALNWLASQMFRLRQKAPTGASFDILLALSRLFAVVYAFLDKTILHFAVVFVVLQGIITVFQLGFAYSGLTLSKPSNAVLRRLAKIGIDLSTISQANWVVMFGDRLILSIFSASSAVAIYSASYQISSILVALSWPFLYALLPRLGEQWKSQDMEGVLYLIRQNTRILMILLTPAVIGLGLTGNDLLRLLATEEFAKGGLLVGMIAGGIALDSIATNLQYLFFVQDKSYVLRPIYISAAGLNLIINLAAIPLFSYYGAGVTTLLTFAYILIRLIRATQLPINTLFDVKTLGQCLLVVVVMGIWVKLTVAPTILGLTVAVAGGGLIYMAGVLMLGILSLQEVRGILRRRSSALYSKSR